VKKLGQKEVQVGHHVADIHRVVQMPRLAFLWMTVAVMYGADVISSCAMQLFEENAQALMCDLSHFFPSAGMSTVYCCFVITVDVTSWSRALV
jgi:hypothetical protein